jgi:hypothetical protein
MRIACRGSLVFLVALTVGCGNGTEKDAAASRIEPAGPPRDAQHQGLIGPHGDHSPHHGGMVLMNGDIHYEVVLAEDGRHEVWFSDATRNELPASVASNVRMEVARPGMPAETVQLTIDDAGEAWVAQARPLDGEGIMVKLRYALQGEPYEIELPFVASTVDTKDTKDKQ